MVQVSCLGLEEHHEENLCCLVLTSRGTNGSVTRFIMQASSPEIKQAWFDDVVQILETQRNFLNGTGAQCFLSENTFKSWMLLRCLTSRLVRCSPSVSNRVPAQGKQIKQPWQRREVSNSVSIWPASSLLCIHGSISAALSTASQHLSALFASAATQSGYEGGECAIAVMYNLCTVAHYVFSFIIFLIPPSLSRFLILVARHHEQLSLHLGLRMELRTSNGWPRCSQHRMEVHQSQFIQTESHTLKFFRKNSYHGWRACRTSHGGLSHYCMNVCVCQL